MDYTLILTVNYPGAEWVFCGDDYSGLTWLDTHTTKPTQEELAALWQPTQEAVAKNSCKAKAKELIAATDWAVLPDVGLANVSDFTAYRATLRTLILNPVADPVWPTEPTPVWS